MIHHERFIASSSQGKQGWLDARQWGVTATTVARAATPRGFEGETIEKGEDSGPIEGNAYMDFGNAQEPFIAAWVKQECGIMPNDWLISSSSDNQRYMATPDGLSLDHTEIAEIKTTGKDFVELKGVPIHYRRQIQWQLFCTGAQRCLFAWLLRAEVNGRMIPAWLEPKSFWIERDQREMDQLLEVADRLLEWRKQNGTVQS